MWPHESGQVDRVSASSPSPEPAIPSAHKASVTQILQMALAGIRNTLLTRIMPHRLRDSPQHTQELVQGTLPSDRALTQARPWPRGLARAVQPLRTPSESASLPPTSPEAGEDHTTLAVEGP